MTPAPQQCENCILVGTRACMYHGYPEDTIPSSCQYKIGTGAEEALECFKGTSIISNLLKHRTSTTSAEQVLEEQITELSEFVHENAEMVQNKLEDKWGDFDLMITSIWKELQKRGREPG